MTTPVLMNEGRLQSLVLGSAYERTIILHFFVGKNSVVLFAEYVAVRQITHHLRE